MVYALRGKMFLIQALVHIVESNQVCDPNSRTHKLFFEKQQIARIIPAQVVQPKELLTLFYLMLSS